MGSGLQEKKIESAKLELTNLESADDYFIYALHGFLGQGSDWDLSLSEFNQSSHFKVAAPNYFYDSDFSNLELNNFYLNINNHLIQKKKYKKIFIGYSLGGRIGLKILEKYQDLFDHYIFVSTHPGLETNEDKQTRQIHDKLWSEKIKKLSWDQFINEWNNQSILDSKNKLVRLEEKYKKELLSLAMIKYSLGTQDNFRDLIKTNQNKITWIVGDQDFKFLELAELLKQKKILLDYKRIFSGHRVLLDNPDSLKIILKSLSC